jgi:hypothetical protein
LNILYKNFIRSKMHYGATRYGLRKRTEDATTEIRHIASKRVFKGSWGFLQDNTRTRLVGSKHNSNPRIKKNMDDRKRGGEERIADNQKIARNK